MNSYSVWAPVWDETHVRIEGRPAEIKRKYQLLQGVERLETWPEHVPLRFSPHRPEGLFLPDTVNNAFGWHLVSGACKAVLEAVPIEDVEYLPVTILNHRDRVASDDYWILNLLHLTPAVDREASEFDVDAADDSKISKFDRLVVTGAVWESGPALLRLEERPRLVLVRDDVVAQLDAAGLTGNAFVPTDDYSTYPRPAP